MTSEAPPFWWQKPDWRAYALAPLSLAYGLVAARRLYAAPAAEISVPVLCVGNLTVGGAGKTPIAMTLAAAAQALGLSPGFLSRGYGGSMSRPHLVDADHDSARSTGDEPLLLARRAPVAVTPDRAAGARMLVAEGCDFLIMDDGFQSARLRFDRAVLVVDSRRGVGNGRVIPGGPMRAPLIDQLRRADAVIRMGSGSAADEVVRKASRAGKPVYEAITRHRPGSGVEGGAFLAFAGIGDPAKFFDTVREAGGTLGLTKSFADHHYYTDEDLRDLEAAAAAAGLGLVTTAKDAVRIRRRSPYADGFLKRLHVLEIEAEFVPANVGTRIIRDTMAAYEERAIGA